MFNLSKIKDSSWLKKFLRSKLFIALWFCLTITVAIGGLIYTWTSITTNFYISYLILEIIIFTMIIILCEIIRFTFRPRSISLQKGLMYGIWFLCPFIGLVIFAIKTPAEFPSLFLSFLALLFTVPEIINFLTKDRGLWRILLYPRTDGVDLNYRSPYPSLLLNKKSKFNINIRNLKNINASISFFGVFNDQQFNSLKKDTYLWRSDLLLKNYAKINCIKRIEGQYESVESFGQSKTNTLLFIPSKSSTKFYIQLNNEKNTTAIPLNKNEVKEGITLHFVYLDIFNRICDYPLIIKLK